MVALKYFQAEEVNDRMGIKTSKYKHLQTNKLIYKYGNMLKYE